MSKNKKALAAKEKGNKHYQSKQYKEAISEYTKAIKLDGSDPAFFSNRCIAYMCLEDYKNALSDANQCIAVKPSWGKGYYRKGCCLMAIGKLDEARAALNDGLKKEPTNDEIKKKLAELEAQLKKGGSSSSNEPPKTAAQAKDLGNDHFKNGRYEQAAEMYTLGLTMCESNEEKATLFCNRAACHATVHNYSEVVKDATSCLERQPDNVKALLRRGLAYESLEKWKLGIEDMKRVLTLEPSAKMASEALVRLERNLRLENSLKS